MGKLLEFVHLSFMKRIRKFQSYGNRIVSMMSRVDNEGVRDIRKSLSDVSIFVRGMVEVIKKEVGTNDAFDYVGFIRKSNGYFRRIQKNVESNYKDISSTVDTTAKSVFLKYRKDIEGTIGKVGFDSKNGPIQEASQIGVSFSGTPNKAFTDNIRQQLQAGHFAAPLIVTVSQEHVKLIQKHIMTTALKGQSFGWGTERVLRDIYPAGVDKVIRKQMEQNVTRIMRTTYMQASNNDTALFVSQNKDVFVGNRRTADGRPCPACQAQDGDFYKPGRVLIDHPNGMCILVPIPYPEEYYTDGIITQAAGDTFDPPLTQAFYNAAPTEQARLMGNKALYRLWQKERFDYDKLVSGKFGTPMPFNQAAVQLKKLGGISEPSVGFFNTQTKTSLNKLMDPADRGTNSFTAIRQKPLGGTGISTGLDLTGLGDDFLSKTSLFSNAEKAKVMALQGEVGANLDFYVFNQRARLLRLYTRKDIEGNFYYMVPDNMAAKQFANINAKAKGVKVTRVGGTNISSSTRKLSFDEVVALDADIDLTTGKGISKIRWNKEGTRGRLTIDEASIDGQELRIYKMKDASGKTFYTFDYKFTQDTGVRMGNLYLKSDLKGFKEIKDGWKFRYHARSETRQSGLKIAHEVVPEKYVTKLNHDLSRQRVDIQKWNSKVGKTKVDFEYYTNKNIDLEGKWGILNSYGNRMFVDVHTSNLDDAVRAFIGASKTNTPISFFKPTAVKGREGFLKNRLKWGGDTVRGTKKVYGSVTDDIVTLKKDLDAKDLKGVVDVYHSSSATTETFVDMMESGSLLSSENRILSGLSNFSDGQSVMFDLMGGGSNGTFARISTASDKTFRSNLSKNLTFRFKKAELNRIDWYGFDDDLYGRVREIKSSFTSNGGRKNFIQKQVKFNSESNEIIFRNSMSFDNLYKIETGTAKRQELLNALTEKGIKTINNIPIEDFIVVPT